MAESAKGKIIGVALAALVVGAGAGAIGFPVEKRVEVPGETVYIDVPGPVQYVDKEVVKEVPVEVVKEVQVSDGKLDDVLRFIWDNNGEVELLTEDLKEKDISLIADRVVQINDFKQLALNEVKKNLFDELDNKKVSIPGEGDVELDDKDMERLRLKDDPDQVLIDDIDWEERDARATIFGSFEQDDKKFNFEARIQFLDGEVDDLSVVSLAYVTE